MTDIIRVEGEEEKECTPILTRPNSFFSFFCFEKSLRGRGGKKICEEEAEVRSARWQNLCKLTGSRIFQGIFILQYVSGSGFQFVFYSTDLVDFV